MSAEYRWIRNTPHNTTKSWRLVRIEKVRMAWSQYDPKYHTKEVAVGVVTREKHKHFVARTIGGTPGQRVMEVSPSFRQKVEAKAWLLTVVRLG